MPVCRKQTVPRISGGQFTYYIKIYQAYLHLIRKTGTTKNHIRFYLIAAYLKRMDKYIKRPPCYEHLAPVFQTLPCDTCHRHLAGSFRASCSGFCKVKSSYQKMCGMSKKIYRGNSWQNSWRYTRRGNSHRTSPEKHRKNSQKLTERKRAG